MPAKQKVSFMLDSLAKECELEYIQPHLYVAEKIKNAIQRADKEETTSQEAVEKEFSHVVCNSGTKAINY